VPITTAIDRYGARLNSLAKTLSMRISFFRGRNANLVTLVLDTSKPPRSPCPSPPVVRKNSIQLPSDKDAGTYLYDIHCLGNSRGSLGENASPPN
jgi:hypothetical protein